MLVTTKRTWNYCLHFLAKIIKVVAVENANDISWHRAQCCCNIFHGELVTFDVHLSIVFLCALLHYKLILNLASRKAKC